MKSRKMSSKFNNSQKDFVLYHQNRRCGNCAKDLKEALNGIQI